MATKKNRVVIVSRIPQAIDWADDKTSDAVDHAIDDGEKAANIAIERANSQRGYNLPATVEQERRSKEGLIRYTEFYGRFFEYGTVYIDAMPFIRPGHRKMRKTFKSDMGHLFRGFRGT